MTVRVPIAPLFTEPRVSSPQTSQRLAGHVLAVLERRDEWLRVRGGDGYEGWTHAGYLAPEPGGGSQRLLLSLGCVAARPGGATRQLPLGAWLDSDEHAAGGETVAGDALPAKFPRDAAAICRTALARFAGTSYQWGGITPWGADCSGFVQTVFWLHGIRLPRDAWQQAQEGKDAGTDMDAAAAGDLLFFADQPEGRITHVGMALGEGRMVHLGLGRGGYAVERLRDTGDAYVQALRNRFRFARRVIA